MSKKKHEIKLVGVVRGEGKAKDRVATAKDAEKVYYFGGKIKGTTFKAFHRGRSVILMSDKFPKGITMAKHKTKNFWYGNSPTGNTMRVYLKKIVGSIIWWA